MSDIAALVKRLRRRNFVAWAAEAADALEALQAGNDDLVKTIEVLQERYAGRRNAALEEAAMLTEAWTTRDGALADYDQAKHAIAAAIRELKGDQVMTDIAALVERLREYSDMGLAGEAAEALEAADEIDRLRAYSGIEDTKAALKQIIDAAKAQAEERAEKAEAERDDWRRIALERDPP